MKPNFANWLEQGLKQLLSVRSLVQLMRAPCNLRELVRLFRLARKLTKREDFFVACRISSALFSYYRALEILPTAETTGVFVSSDTNPEPIAYIKAAQALGVPTVYISHAFPTELCRSLSYDLSILEGDASLARYKEIGAVKGLVTYCGFEGESKLVKPSNLLKKNPVIGIFPAKAVNWHQFGKLIEDCQLLCSPKSINIRWHPSMFGKSKLSDLIEDRSGIIETEPSLTLEEVASQCDWVITDENSNANLEVLKLGVPVVPLQAARGLEGTSPDLYGFKENQIIPPPIQSINKSAIENMAEFYSDEWTQRFVRYDASYMNDPATLSNQVRNQIVDLLSNTKA